MSKETIKPDPSKATTQDAKMVAESMVEKESSKEKGASQKEQKVDFDEDYAMAQEMSHGSDEKSDQQNA